MGTVRSLLRRQSRQIILLAAVAAICFIVSQTLFQLMLIQGRSMEPTYRSGQFVLLQKQYEPVSGDAAAFRSKKLGLVVVKRIAAVPGDRVDIQNGTVLVNDIPFDSIDTSAGDLPMPITLDEDEYFLLGDNRSESRDSRHSEVGLIRRADLVGKVLPQRTAG